MGSRGPLKKGDRLPGAGRPKGSKSKPAENVRKAYQLLIENNIDNLTLWLERVAMNDPAKALDYIAKLSTFILPKLQTTDINLNGSPIKVVLPPKPEDIEDIEDND